MFLILAFLVVGGASYALSRVGAGAIALVALTIALMPVFAGIVWFYEMSGSGDLIDGTWQFLSGLEGPEQLDADCPTGMYEMDGGDNATFLLKILVTFVVTLGGGAALLAFPFVLLACAIFGFGTVFFETDEYYLQYSAYSLLLVIGTFIVAGLGFRLIHFLSIHSC